MLHVLSAAISRSCCVIAAFCTELVFCSLCKMLGCGFLAGGLPVRLRVRMRDPKHWWPWPCKELFYKVVGEAREPLQALLAGGFNPIVHGQHVEQRRAVPLEIDGAKEKVIKLFELWHNETLCPQAQSTARPKTSHRSTNTFRHTAS